MNQTTGMYPTTYNLRWFVWTIVFLLTTGVSLVTYITYTSIIDDSQNYTSSQVHFTKKLPTIKK